jgi:transposase
MGGKTRPAYPAEFRQQIVELYATGRRIKELSAEFGCSEQSIATWVKRAGRLSALPDRGAAVLRTHRQARAVAEASALSAKERSELEQLRKEVRRLQTERDILANRLRGAPPPLAKKHSAPRLSARLDSRPLAFWRFTTP